MFEHTKINPDRTKRESRPTGANLKKIAPNPDEIAVYTFSEAVMSNGMPLVFRGTLRAAQEARVLIMEAARNRNDVAPKIGSVALNEPEEMYTMGISDAEREAPEHPYIDTDVDQDSLV